MASDANVRGVGAMVVNLNWGVKGLIREETFWDSSAVGELEWDDDFTVAPVENQ